VASTVITPVGDALAALLQTITFTPTLHVHWDTANDTRWAPSRLRDVPAVTIDIPTVRRTALDEGERELGSDDWLLTFPVSLYVDLKVAGRDQQRAVELLEAVIAAIDANRTLGIPTIDDTKLVAGEPSLTSFSSDQARPLVEYECEVQVWKRVPYP